MNKIKIGFIILFTLLLVVPFANKAFHIDDWVTIKFVRLTLQHFCLPYKEVVTYMGQDVPVYKVGHQPLIYLYYTLWLWLFPNINEAGSHLVFSIFPMIAGVSMFFLSKRFTRYPFYAASLLIASPIFLVMSHSIMTDVPSFALFLLAMTSYIYGIDKDNKRLLFLSSIFVSLALFSSYLSLILIPLLVLYGFLNRRNFKQILIPLLLPIILFCIWSIYNLFYFGKVHILEAANPSYLSSVSALHNIPRICLKILQLIFNAGYYVNGIGGAIIFPLSILFLYRNLFTSRIKRMFFLLFIIFLFLWGINLITEMNYNLFDTVLSLAFFYCGIMVIYRIFEIYLYPFSLKTHKIYLDNNKLIYSSSAIFLSIWFLGFMIFVILLAPFGALRYLIFLIPPAIILFIEDIENNLFRYKIQFIRATFLFTLIFTIINTFFLAVADYEYAAVYKQFSEYVQRYKTEDNKIWFIGELGLRHYLEKQGCFYLSLRDFPENKGDIVIIPKIIQEIFSFQINPKLKNHLILEENKTYKSKVPIKLMNKNVHAGFYGNFGMLPYTFSNAALEEFEIYKVQ